jgi:hypothetical protein
MQLLYILIAFAAGTTDKGLGREIAERTIRGLTDAERPIPFFLPVTRHEPLHKIGGLSLEELRRP